MLVLGYAGRCRALVHEDESASWRIKELQDIELDLRFLKEGVLYLVKSFCLGFAMPQMYYKTESVNRNQANDKRME